MSYIYTAIRRLRTAWEEPPSFVPKKCKACGQSIRRGERRSKWGFPGVSYNRRDKCFHGRIRAAGRNYVTRCARTPKEASKFRNDLIRRLISENKIAKMANIRWKIKRKRENSLI